MLVNFDTFSFHVKWLSPSPNPLPNKANQETVNTKEGVAPGPD